MFSDPVVGESFFGRQAIIDLLFKRADALKSGYRQNVAIIGHRQLGKTSILRHFLHTYRDPQILTVYIEIKLPALGHFIDQFVRSLLFQCLTHAGVGAPASEALPALAEKASPLIPKTVGRIGEITNLLRQRRAEEAYARLFELTSVVKQETGKNCIVVVDEFHRLGELGVKNAFSNFGKRIMVQKDTLYLLASSSFSASRKILAEKLALLFGNFERIYLEPFDFDASFEFLEKRLAPVTVPENLKRFLVAFTDGHPFFLDTIARRLGELASSKRETEVSRGTVTEALCKLLFESQGILHQFFLKTISPWLRPDSRGGPVLVLTELARGTGKLKDIARALRWTQREVSARIQELMEQELVIKTGVFYRFHDKIFKFWLREVYEKKELSLLGPSAKTDDFIRRLHEIIAEHEELLKIAAADRVVNLFSLFNNEIVAFGEKKRKLPHFTEFIPAPEGGSACRGSSRSLIAKGHGRCWLCKIVEEKATEKEVLDLVRNPLGKKKGPVPPHGGAPTRVLVALGGVDENAKLLAKEKRVLTLGLSRINMLMDVFGGAPIVQTHSR